LNRRLVLILGAALLAVGAIPVLAVGSARAALIVALAWLLLGTALLWLLYRSADRRLDEVARAFKRFGRGDFAARLSPTGSPALRELARVFNESAFRTGELVRQLEAQRETFQATIAAMRDGILLVDRFGRITLANAAFERLCGLPDAVGRFHWEAIRDPALAEMVRSAATSAGHEPRPVTVDGRDYLCTTAWLERTDGVLVTFHDVTDLNRILRMKRDFVGNVAHELRTPLTAISGFVETMEENVSEPNRRPLEIVKRHTDRLVRLVGDLATLAALEDEAAPAPEFQPVRLDQLCRDVLALFEPRLRARGIAWRIDVRPDVPAVPGDRYRLEQALVNLVDNAVNYTEQGEITVTVEPRADRVAVTVADTGIGIDRRNLDRVFERFWVADKSRSRISGGTGLGLAIVKHIAALHGGEVTVTSEPGRGSAFTLLLPLASPPQPAPPAA
jgi:two-component system phosphate regulon sensor histidine kinase PhoR